MKYSYINFLFVLSVMVLMISCKDISKEKTSMEVQDNNRHYYPVLAGQLKDISFTLKNTGKNPLVITDIITSCGCLNVEEGFGMFTIPPGKERILTLTYNSAKNIGYVKHFITLYGNFENELFKELVFDINVVPNALYTKDYEEMYSEEVKASGGIKEFVDGNESSKGYYLDEDLNKGIQ